MLARITVPMAPAARSALVRLAHTEKRDPRQQAAVMLEAELRRRGLLNLAERPALAEEGVPA